MNPGLPAPSYLLGQAGDHLQERLFSLVGVVPAESPDNYHGRLESLQHLSPPPQG